MRGTYRGDERSIIRQQWKDVIIPQFHKVEVEPLRYFVQHRTDMITLDVGANKGFWAKCMLDTYSVSHVYMIDASPENIVELQNEEDSLVFFEQDFAKISAYHYALSSRKGFTTLYTNEDGSPLASLYSHNVEGIDVFGGLDKTLRVPMTSIDDFLADHAEIKRVDVLKLDVEGAEYNVLIGAHGAIANRKIDIITFEFGLHQVDARNFFRDFYFLLTNSGYRLFNISHEGTLSSVEKYEYRFENFGDQFTYVAERIV